MHGLFGLPVLNEDELEDKIQMDCRLQGKPQRVELINASRFIPIDEFPFNNRECFEACCRQFQEFEEKVIVCFGDFRQTSPIVKDGSIAESINACIQSSKYWPGVEPQGNFDRKFQIYKLKTNMRLEKLNQDLVKSLENIDQELSLATTCDRDREELISRRTQVQENCDRQIRYAKMLLQIGDGERGFGDDTADIEQVYISEETCTTHLVIKNLTTYKQIEEENITLEYLLDECDDIKGDDERLQFRGWIAQPPTSVQDIKIMNDAKKDKFVQLATAAKTSAIEELYPNGFDSADMQRKTILATTNSQVDAWNELIQKMNPNFEKIGVDRTLACKYLSNDTLGEVDDPHDRISEMLTDELLNEATSKEAPPHELTLCVGDICYLLRTLSRSDRLATNTRVRILALRQYCIQVQTCSDIPTSHWIPRIRFTFSMRWGTSYQLTRTQFPLRLAYAVTVNKSQGQEYEQVLFDVTAQPFSHGQCYVAMSRIRRFDTIKIYIGENSMSSTGDPIITNVVYPKLLESILN